MLTHEAETGSKSAYYVLLVFSAGVVVFSAGVVVFSAGVVVFSAGVVVFAAGLVGVGVGLGLGVGDVFVGVVAVGDVGLVFVVLPAGGLQPVVLRLSTERTQTQMDTPRIFFIS